MSNTHKFTISISIALICSFFIFNFIYAWIPAPSNPPADNASAPINVANSAQVKAGQLQLNGFRNIGTTLLEGPLQITSGSPGNGKVLTSDASGRATWQTPASSNKIASFSGSLNDFIGKCTAWHKMSSSNGFYLCKQSDPNAGTMCSQFCIDSSLNVTQRTSYNSNPNFSYVVRCTLNTTTGSCSVGSDVMGPAPYGFRYSDAILYWIN